MARLAMSGGKGRPCQPSLFSTSENPRPLMVRARITVGWPPLPSSAVVNASSISPRSWPLISSTRAPNAEARRA